MGSRGDERYAKPSRLALTCRALGRACGWVGSGARSVVNPLKSAGRRRPQPAVCHLGSLQLAVQEAPPPGAEPSLLGSAPSYTEAVKKAQQKWSSQLQCSAELLKRMVFQLSPTELWTASAEGLRWPGLFSQRSTSGYLSADCFPPQLVAKRQQSTLPGAADAQDLVSVGSREMFRIKLYDFAVYLDRKQVKLNEKRLSIAIPELQPLAEVGTFQVRQSQLTKKLASKPKISLENEHAELDLARNIRDSQDIEMSLMVRASRNLPIRLLAKEYERILKRRLRVVGGTSNDPTLRVMLDKFRHACHTFEADCGYMHLPSVSASNRATSARTLRGVCFCREEALPEEIKQGGSVRKGTVLAFTRDCQGNIHATANGHDLVTVQSQKLAQAVFDIYLGNQVVSTKARRDAGHSFIKMIDDIQFQPPVDGLVCREQACKVGRIF